MIDTMKSHLTTLLEEIEESGLYKRERIITSPQQARINVQTGETVLNMCANNYLGLSNHPEIIKAAKEGVDQWGHGLSSVRFICGTQAIHTALEKKISEFLETEDTILYTSCFDANAGLFETLLTEEDAILSDELNHASIIDGIRLCKAKRLRFKNSDMGDLEAKLKDAQDSRFRLVATDGVFSMDGTIANLQDLCDLADKIRRTGHDRRFSCNRIHGENGEGHTRIPRRYGQNRHYHQHARKGARRCQRRIHNWQE